MLDGADASFRAFIALCAFAGPRLGEAAALRVSDIDVKAQTLRVERQNAGLVDIRPPKFGSERTIFLADSLLRILTGHVAHHVEGADPQRWLFEGERGNPSHRNSVGYWWRRARTAAECPDTRLHDLRHLYASRLIAAGCDVVTVQRALGHSSATITLNTYAHLWPTAEDRTRRGAESMLNDVLGSD